MSKLIRVEAPNPNERHYKMPDKNLPDGIWLQEPDKVVWIDEVTKLDCMLLRNDLGSWCGYVGVPELHPYFGFSCSKVEFAFEREARHGEDSLWQTSRKIDFSDTCQAGTSEDERFVCHCRAHGHGEIWWFGFHCADSYDYSPGLNFQFVSREYYRDIN